MDEKITFNGKVLEEFAVGVKAEAFGKSGFIPFSHLPYVSFPSSPPFAPGLVLTP